MVVEKSVCVNEISVPVKGGLVLHMRSMYYITVHTVS